MCYDIDYEATYRKRLEKINEVSNDLLASNEYTENEMIDRIQLIMELSDVEEILKIHE